MGLENAAVLLLAAAKLLLFASAWQIVRRLAGREAAWFAVALLIITVGSYGAFDVFEYLEGYLSARTLAEALVVAALACAVAGARLAALLVIGLGLAIHPIMAFPGLLLLLGFWLSPRLACWGAAAGIASAAAIAVAPTLSTSVAARMPLMDPVWLEVVRERSEFLFLQFWKFDSWDKHGRAFLCLSLTAICIPDLGIRRLSIAAMLVGAAGLAVAAIAGTIGPVPILLQGQAWRWFWVTSLVCVLLLPLTAMRVWREPACGPLCALALLSSWTFAEEGRSACALLALALWCLRGRFSAEFAPWLRWAAIAWGIMILCWILANTWTFSFFGLDLHQEALSLQKLRNILALHAPAVFLAWCAIHGLGRARGSLVPFSIAVVFAAAAALTLPTSLNLTHRPRTEPADQYAQWQRAIPADGNVYVADGTDNPRFAWFELGRLNYVSVDQSAGVVFSRATAVEIERRAADLLPLVPMPDWKIRSHNLLSHGESTARSAQASGVDYAHPLLRPLTPTVLVEVCADPVLGFLIAREHLGFDPITHRGPGKFKDWNLYDCRHVRSLGSAS
jgi:hypothetical protein